MLDSPPGDDDVFCSALLAHSLKKFCAYIKFPIKIIIQLRGGWVRSDLIVVIENWPEN